MHLIKIGALIDTKKDENRKIQKSNTLESPINLNPLEIHLIE